MQEVIKWGFPHFEYKGLVGSMAAFKQHCSFGFWKGKLLSDPEKLFARVGDIQHRGRKIRPDLHPRFIHAECGNSGKIFSFGSRDAIPMMFEPL